MFHLTSTITKPTRLESLHRPVRDYLPEAVLMRHATAADSARIRVLARLDDKRLPDSPFLVAEVSGEIVAAISLSTGTVVADPFRPTSDAVAMLVLRTAQLSGSDRLATQRSRLTERSPARVAA